MEKDEALEILAKAPYDDKPCRMNPNLTRRCGVDMIRKCVEAIKGNGQLSSILELRVWQVGKDLRRPKFRKKSKAESDLIGLIESKGW